MNRVLIIGAGGVGSMLAVLMDHAGREVTLLGRGKNFQAAREKGLRADANGTEISSSHRLRFVLSSAEVEAKVDQIILATKSFDTEESLRAVSTVVENSTVFICLQNGTENEAIIKQHFSTATIVGGVINGHYSLPEPGYARWEGSYGSLAGALYSGDVERARQAWQDNFSGMLLPQIFVDGPQAAARIKWSKLVLNCGFNAINALTGLAPDEIIAHPEHGALATAAFQEAFAVMRALELAPLDLPGAQITLIEKICQKPLNEAQRKLMMITPKGSHEVQSSMRQDVLQGRKSTEIQEINGAVVKAGKRLGIPTPANEEIVLRLKA